MKDLIGIPPRAESPLGRVFRVLVILVFFTLVVGLLIDLLSGLPITRGACSVLVWVAGILGLGSLYVVGEMGAEWISQKDRVSDPLHKRVLRLLALIGFVSAVVLGMIAADSATNKCKINHSVSAPESLQSLLIQLDRSRRVA